MNKKLIAGAATLLRYDDAYLALAEKIQEYKRRFLFIADDLDTVSSTMVDLDNYFNTKNIVEDINSYTDILKRTTDVYDAVDRIKNYLFNLLAYFIIKVYFENVLPKYELTYGFTLPNGEHVTERLVLEYASAGINTDVETDKFPQRFILNFDGTYFPNEKRLEIPTKTGELKALPETGIKAGADIILEIKSDRTINGSKTEPILTVYSIVN